MKKCSRCKEEKDLSLFNVDNHAKTGFRSHCKSCVRVYQIENRERYNAGQRRWRFNHKEQNKSTWRKYTYGITTDDYNNMLKSQDGKCAICRHAPLPGKELHIDHNHRTDRVRGLLCQKCNVYIGMIHENKETVKRMFSYLSEAIPA